MTGDREAKATQLRELRSFLHNENGRERTQVGISYVKWPRLAFEAEP